MHKHNATPPTEPPEGWKLVPVEPTVEMRNAGWNALSHYAGGTRACAAGAHKGVWAQMLRAALQPPAAQAPDEVVERLMTLADDYAQAMAADGGCGLSPSERDKETEACRSALRTALSQAVPQSGGLSDAARDVLAERGRQVSVEGWTPEHDDEHADGSMALAAAVYANPEIWNVFGASRIGWPWDASWYKPSDPRRDLVKATALLLAEIERRDRAALQRKGD